MAGTTEYKNQCLKENNDRIYLIVPKGKKEKIKKIAEKNGESLNGFINHRKKQTAKGYTTEKQLKYIRGLTQYLGWEEKTLRQFIEKQYHISNVNWLTSKQAAKLIEGLKSIWEKDKKDLEG
ncbi:phage protein GemA/Gp16 family protein [Lachnospiraceae bacterium 46-61]